MTIRAVWPGFNVFNFCFTIFEDVKQTFEKKNRNIR